MNKQNFIERSFKISLFLKRYKYIEVLLRELRTY